MVVPKSRIFGSELSSVVTMRVSLVLNETKPLLLLQTLKFMHENIRLSFLKQILVYICT